MQLEGLQLKNFRCYDELNIDFDARLTVIVGQNGKGKTAIFDAIAMGLEPYLRAWGLKGRRLSAKDVRRVPIYKEDGRHIAGMETRYPAEISLRGGADGNSYSSCCRLDQAGTLSTQAESLESCARGLREAAQSPTGVLLPAFAYYGTQRIWVDSSLMQYDTRPLSERSVGYEECLEPSSSYNTFGQWFEQVEKQALAEQQYSAELQQNVMIRNAIQQAVDVCLRSVGLHDLYYNHKLGCFVVSHPQTGEMLVDDLSDGFRSIISMVADLAYRMVRLNPQLGEDAVVDTPALVLIDEVEMHLHPLWQQTVLLDLQRAFPKTQFIVTTHSPQVLTSVAPECIRVLSWGKEFEGVRRVSFSLGADSTQLLREIQQVDPRPQTLPIVQELKRYLELVSQDQWDSAEALSMRKQLDDWSQGREPALLRADMDIRLRQFRRGRK